MGNLSWGGVGRYNLGRGWTDSRGEQVRHFRGWTYVAIDAICKKFAMQRPGIYVVRRNVQGERRMKYLGETYRRKALMDLKPHEELEPVDESHPLHRLLSHPNPVDSAYDFWYETGLFLHLTGSYYWWAPKNGFSVPCELWVLPSHWVWPIVGDDSQIVEYELRPLFSSYSIGKVPADEVIHGKFKNPTSKVDGFAPLSAINTWIDCAESIDLARYSSFANGSYPRLAVTLDPETADPGEAELERLEAKLEAKFRGVSKFGKTLILGGVKDIKPVEMTPVEMAYKDSDDQARDKVLAGFRVSKVIAGIATDINRASMEGAQVSFCELVINPLTYQLGATATEKLARQFDEKIRIVWLSCTPDDPTQKLAEQQADVAAGAVTPNEIRHERGREPYEHGGDDPILPMGSVPMPLSTGEDQSDLLELMKPPVAEGSVGMNGTAGNGGGNDGLDGSPPNRIAAMFGANGNGTH